MIQSAAPLSAYAQWKIEEEERFYATFPQARCPSYQLPDAYYADADSSYFKTHRGLPKSVDPIFPLSNSILPAPTSPTSLPLSEDFSHHYDRLPIHHTAAPAAALLHAPPSPNCHARFSNGPGRCPDALQRVTESQLLGTYASSDDLAHPHTLVPSQSLSPINTRDVPIMDHLPTPPDSTGPEASSSRIPTHDYLIQDSTNRSYPTPATDHWQDHTLVDGHLPPRELLEHHHHSQPPSPTHPFTTGSNPYPRALTTRGLPLSPLPAASKKPVLRKPPLACHFCRGRKIACGAPDPSNLDRTCNQCERRSLKCEYPSESRRGMRKKKTSTSHQIDTTKSKGKVKLGRRPKASAS